jgi:hypothetical protein
VRPLVLREASISRENRTHLRHNALEINQDGSCTVQYDEISSNESDFLSDERDNSEKVNISVIRDLDEDEKKLFAL